MTKIFFSNLAWIAAAALLGFLIAAIFAGQMRLPRSLYLAAYVGLAAPFLFFFFRWSERSGGAALVELVRHNWVWGLVGAALFGAFTVRNVLSQPASPAAAGLPLAFDLAWSGVVYGLVDALLLSVLPVVATWGAFSALGWTGSWTGRIAAGLVAVLASLFVTAAYHLGYPEYRGSGLFGPVIGNGVMTLGTVLSTNPLTAVLSHIAMHLAGVLHGPATVTQLPPHF